MNDLIMRMYTRVGQEMARKEAEAWLEWVTAPIRERLMKDVKKGVTTLEVTSLEWRALVAYYADRDETPETIHQGDEYHFYGLPIKVKEVFSG